MSRARKQAARHSVARSHSAALNRRIVAGRVNAAKSPRQDCVLTGERNKVAVNRPVIHPRPNMVVEGLDT